MELSELYDRERTRAFVEESNRIERIFEVEPAEIAAHERLWKLKAIRRADLEEFVTITAKAVLRRDVGQNVSIVNTATGEVLFQPPPGGPGVVEDLELLLKRIYQARVDPYEAHVRYESLHPFTDGNGRSGRALWAWQMFRRGQDPLGLGFLHTFYYQALQSTR